MEATCVVTVLLNLTKQDSTVKFRYISPSPLNWFDFVVLVQVRDALLPQTICCKLTKESMDFGA